ncbi:MAG TPA: GntR family transcriptional regulator [Burkholderiaceae bacterium]|nr:GntR family transcriptional regulator [Burkholderiaceae bacterium]
MRGQPAATTADSVAAALRSALHRGRWEAGAALRQEELAAEFGVSRIPVREALSKLHAEGLVVVEPNRGAFVASLSVADVREVFDLRVLLECDALRHAIPAHTPRTLRQLHALQAELDAEDDPTLWLATDAAFHEVLYAPSGRSKTLEMIAMLRASVTRLYRAHLSPNTRRKGWRDEHHALLKAVAAGQVERAIAALTRHLRATEAVALTAVGGNAEPARAR